MKERKRAPFYETPCRGQNGETAYQISCKAFFNMQNAKFETFI